MTSGAAVEPTHIQSRRCQEKTSTALRAFPILSPPTSYPPHPILRVLGRPRRQKLLHQRRMAFFRSQMQRRASSLRRAASLRQDIPLFAQVRAPPPAPATPSVPRHQKGAKPKRNTRRRLTPEHDDAKKCVLSSALVLMSLVPEPMRD
jgi:hypothetical protein